MKVDIKAREIRQLINADNVNIGAYEWTRTELQLDDSTADIFISHASTDKLIAASLISLLIEACGVESKKIRCTSISGYRLRIGADFEERLRLEVNRASLFIALVTPESVKSDYVMFEIGARWGANLPLMPVFAAGAGAGELRGFLQNLNAVDLSVQDDAQQFIEDTCYQLKLTKPRAIDIEKHAHAIASAASKPAQKET